MKTPFKLALILGGAALLAQGAGAQSLFSESFNYTPGSELGGNANPGNSVAWSGGNVGLSIGSAQLTYPGLQEAAGNDLVYTSGGTTGNSYNTYPAVSSGSIYYSFLIDCTALPTANNYIGALNASPATPGGSTDDLSTYVGASGAGWKIGVRTSGGGSGGSYSGALSLDTTYLVVEELTYGSTSVANLYVDPVPGASQPGTPTATQSTTSTLTAVSDVGFKVQSAASTGDFDIGNLLIATDWSGVTPASTVPEPSTLALLVGAGIAAAAAKLRRRTPGC